MDFYAFRSAARTFFADAGADAFEAGENDHTTRPRSSIIRPANRTLTGLLSLAWEHSTPEKKHRE
jgi:hypothetical protein